MRKSEKMGFYKFLFVLVLFSTMMESCTGAHGDLLNGSTVNNNTDFPNQVIDDGVDELPGSEPTQAIGEMFQQKCVEISEDVPQNLELHGVLVLGNYLYDLQTNKKIQLVEEGTSLGYAVSPNLANLAFVTYEKNIKVPDKVMITNSQGKVTREFSISGMVPEYWINDDILLLSNGAFDSNLVPFEAISLDLRTGEMTEINNELPLISRGVGTVNSDHWGIGGGTRILVNSTQKYLIYPSTDIETQPATDDLILWDIGNNQKVTSIRTNVLNSSPFWSKENTFFITEADEEYLTHQNVNYLGGEEIIRVSVDGQIERLSYMTTTKEVYTYDYMLSPDEEKLSLKIAYGLDEIINPAQPHHIAILTINDKTVVDLCISGIGYSWWSPDGHYLVSAATEIEEPRYGDIEYVYIIDPNNNIAYLVTTANGSPVYGWMIP